MNIFKKTKTFIFILLSFLFTIIIIEIFSWYVLKTQWNNKDLRAPNNDYMKIYYERFHPLWHDNHELRIRKKLINFSNIFGFKNNVLSYHYKKYENFSSILETDNYGFFHNGNISSNKILFENKKIFKIFLVGGSSVAGKGATQNSKTIAANIENYLQQKFGNEIIVVNAAIFASTQYLNYLHYENYLFKFDPDVIIFLGGSNDFFYLLKLLVQTILYQFN